MLRDMNKPSEVVSHLRAAIRLDPTTVNAYTYLGDTLNNLKLFDEAVQVYSKALSFIDPNFGKQPNSRLHPSAMGMAADVHFRTADAYSNMKSAHKAHVHYQRGAQLDPDNGEVLAGLWFNKLETLEWQALDESFKSALTVARKASL